MGQEFAQRREWSEEGELDWRLLDAPAHKGVQTLIRDLNRLHRSLRALHLRDSEPGCFAWIIGDDRDQSVFAFARFGEAGDPPVVVINNFTPEPRHNYTVGLPRAGIWREILNTDATVYGGSGVGNFGSITARDVPAHGQPASAQVTLPPLATLYFVPEA
jgi:1,4-alpha-glucan branching enzyme